MRPVSICAGGGAVGSSSQKTAGAASRSAGCSGDVVTVIIFSEHFQASLPKHEGRSLVENRLQ
jgi:hypothetical protein